MRFYLSRQLKVSHRWLAASLFSASIVAAHAWGCSADDLAGDPPSAVDAGLPDVTSADATTNVDASDGAPDARGPGASLFVDIASPDGGTVSVTVTGPGSFSRTLAASEKLVELEPGTYQVSSGHARVPGVVVSTLHVPSVASSPVTLASGARAT